MYGIPLDGNVRLRTNANLREYARLEYRNEDVLWLGAAIQRSTAPRKPRRPLRLLARFARPAHRAVAHKGTPRLEARESGVPG